MHRARNRFVSKINGGLVCGDMSFLQKCFRTIVLIKPIRHLTSSLKTVLNEHALPARVAGYFRWMVDVLLPPQPITPLQSVETNDQSHHPVLQTGMDIELWSKIRFLDNDGCDMCARPFEGGLYLGEGSHCVHCTKDPFRFTSGRAACLYDQTTKGLILAYKYGDRLDLTTLLRAWISRSACDILSLCDAVVPVPLHRSRLLQRRYNQAAELARPLAKQYNKIYLANDLKRIKSTSKQGKDKTGEVGRQQRWDNVKEAFAIPAKSQSRFKDKHIVLIDDVMTTGATLDECAKTLLNAGARRVDVAIIARAVKLEL